MFVHNRMAVVFNIYDVMLFGMLATIHTLSFSCSSSSFLCVYVVSVTRCLCDLIAFLVWFLS